LTLFIAEVSFDVVVQIQSTGVSTLFTVAHRVFHSHPGDDVLPDVSSDNSDLSASQ